jgi:hypothetical protein
MLVRQYLRAEFKSEKVEAKAPTPNPAVACASDYSEPLTRAQHQRMRKIAAEEKRTGTWVAYKPES